MQRNQRRRLSIAAQAAPLSYEQNKHRPLEPGEIDRGVKSEAVSPKSVPQMDERELPLWLRQQ